LKPQSMQQHLIDKLTNMLIITSNLKIHVQLKMRIFSQYIQSQMLSDLKVYDFTQTWVEQSLDALCIKYARDWLELPVSACIAEILVLPRNQGGFGINLFNLLSDKMRLMKRHALWTSSETELQFIASDTAQANCKIDEYVVKHKDVSKAKKALKSDYVQKAFQHITNLVCQGSAFKEVCNLISKANIGLWSKVVESLPASKLIFTRKALSQILHTASNLVRWKWSTDLLCHQCSTGYLKPTNMFCQTAVQRSRSNGTPKDTMIFY
jgi:hypothetical protein